MHSKVIKVSFIKVVFCLRYEGNITVPKSKNPTVTIIRKYSMVEVFFLTIMMRKILVNYGE